MDKMDFGPLVWLAYIGIATVVAAPVVGGIVLWRWLR